MNKKIQNILITGSTGFIGRNLVEYFQKIENYNLFTPTEYELDLVDSEKVKKFLGSTNIHIIIHSATVLQKNKAYASTVCEENLRMFFNLYMHKKPSTRFVNIGSGSEYSRAHWIPQMNEEYFDKNIPSDGHSFSKYLISKYIITSNDKNLIGLRLFGIFGKYEDYKYKFISNCIVKNLLGLPIIINQNVIYDYLYINDLGKILYEILQDTFSEKILNVTPTNSFNLIEINDEVQSILKIKRKYEVLKPGYGSEYTGNNALLMKKLNNFKFTDLTVSLIDLIEYYKNEIHMITKNEMMDDKFLEYAKKINP
jgi:UDP-glucose 4-epimerase